MNGLVLRIQIVGFCEKFLARKRKMPFLKKASARISHLAIPYLGALALTDAVTDYGIRNYILK